jgi:hypothetical protein
VLRVITALVFFWSGLTQKRKYQSGDDSPHSKKNTAQLTGGFVRESGGSP